MYRESNAETPTPIQNNNSGAGNGYGGGDNGYRGGDNGYRGGRGRGRGNRGGDRGRRAGRGTPRQPEKYGSGYDTRREPSHRRERVGRVCYNKSLAREGGRRPQKQLNK